VPGTFRKCQARSPQIIEKIPRTWIGIRDWRLSTTLRNW